ncbi:MAG: hypothetical protein AB1489_05010 [Acidobacteriota bacterium]
MLFDNNTIAPIANYSEAQTANFFAQAQRSMLFAKLAATEKNQQNDTVATNTDNPPAVTLNESSAGVTVNIVDVKKVIVADQNGKRAANQSIKITYEVIANGTKRQLTASEINARAQRDQYLKLTDEKGNLTPLGKQFDRLTSNDLAVVTELGTDIHQLAILVNGGNKPSPEKEATILAGLVSTGLASVAVDANGKVSFSIVPYRVASTSQIINAGEQAKTDFENIKAILPGLKDVQGIVSLSASIYAATVVALAAAPAGLVASSALSGLAGETTDKILKDGRLPTTQEAATSVVLSVALAGGGLIGGKIVSNIKNGGKITEIPLSISTQARTAKQEASKLISIFGNKVPRSNAVKPVTTSDISANRTGDVAAGIEVVEQAAKTEAKQLEQLDGGHSIDRHGPEVSLADLEKRLKTGIAPDNTLSFAPASTKFNSYENWIKTREKALELIRTKYNVDLIQPPSPGDKPYREITIEYNRAIDDGYIPDLSTKQKVTVIDPITGKIKKGNVFSTVDFIEGVTGTYTRVAWDQAQGKWVVVQHFPVAENWDNLTKAYTEPLMFKATLP